jgi:hypothetical protein
MKKYFVVILMAIVVAMPSRAQVRFGLKGGLNLTQMSVSNSSVEDMFKNKAGYFAGPTIKIALPIVGLGIDVAALYDYREAEIEVSNTQNNTVTEKLKQQSIQVPINVRYGVGLGSTANLFIFAGPQFGFNVGDKDKKLFDEAAEWTLRSSNVSANVGLGLLLMDYLQLSANYNIALGKTGEVDFKSGTSAAWDTVRGKAKANAWQIALAFYF